MSETITNLPSDSRMLLLRLNQLKEQAWEELKNARLQKCTEEELELMKNLWMHGFSKGAESSFQTTMESYEATKSIPQ